MLQKITQKKIVLKKGWSATVYKHMGSVNLVKQGTYPLSMLHLCCGK